jgi:hypothetical protein
MKCSNCGNEMVQSRAGWLCISCGHVEASATSAIADSPIATGAEAHDQLKPPDDPPADEPVKTDDDDDSAKADDATKSDDSTDPAPPPVAAAPWESADTEKSDTDKPVEEVAKPEDTEAKSDTGAPEVDLSVIDEAVAAVEHNAAGDEKPSDDDKPAASSETASDEPPAEDAAKAAEAAAEALAKVSGELAKEVPDLPSTDDEAPKHRKSRKRLTHDTDAADEKDEADEKKPEDDAKPADEKKSADEEKSEDKSDNEAPPTGRLTIEPLEEQKADLEATATDEKPAEDKPEETPKTEEPVEAVDQTSTTDPTADTESVDGYAVKDEDTDASADTDTSTGTDDAKGEDTDTVEGSSAEKVEDTADEDKPEESEEKSDEDDDASATSPVIIPSGPDAATSPEPALDEPDEADEPDPKPDNKPDAEPTSNPIADTPPETAPPAPPAPASPIGESGALAIPGTPETTATPTAPVASGAPISDKPPLQPVTHPRPFNAALTAAIVGGVVLVGAAAGAAYLYLAAPKLSLANYLQKVSGAKSSAFVATVDSTNKGFHVVVKADGKGDITNPDQPKLDVAVTGEATYHPTNGEGSDVTGSITGQATVLDQAAYFKLDNLKGLGTVLPANMAGQWYKFDLSKSDTSKCATTGKQLSSTLSNNVLNTIPVKDAAFVGFDSFDNNKALHYRGTIDNAKLKSTFDQVNKGLSAECKLEFNADDFKTVTMKYELWRGWSKDRFKLTATDSSDNSKSTVTLDTGAYNKPVKVTAPSGVKDAAEIFSGTELGASTFKDAAGETTAPVTSAATRDAQRQSDLALYVTAYKATAVRGFYPINPRPVTVSATDPTTGASYVVSKAPLSGVGQIQYIPGGVCAGPAHTPGATGSRYLALTTALESGAPYCLDVK